MIMDRFRVDGQVAVITGGTRGIGYGIALALGEAGARLIVSSKNPNPDAMASFEKAGATADWVQADMADPTGPQALIDKAVDLAGRVDILVNNAGVSDSGPTADFTDEQWRRIMEVNFDAVFRCSRAALKPMLAHGAGVILNVGSMSGIVSNIPQHQTAYNSSKAAVHMITKTMASELADKGIRVNALAPGYVDTDMSRDGLNNPDWAPTWMQMTPMGRAATIEECAAAGLYLCSPASSYTTGAVLVVDGGYTAR